MQRSKRSQQRALRCRQAAGHAGSRPRGAGDDALWCSRLARRGHGDFRAPLGAHDRVLAENEARDLCTRRGQVRPRRIVVGTRRLQRAAAGARWALTAVSPPPHTHTGGHPPPLPPAGRAPVGSLPPAPCACPCAARRSSSPRRTGREHTGAPAEGGGAQEQEQVRARPPLMHGGRQPQGRAAAIECSIEARHDQWRTSAAGTTPRHVLRWPSVRSSVNRGFSHLRTSHLPQGSVEPGQGGASKPGRPPPPAGGAHQMATGHAISARPAMPPTVASAVWPMAAVL